MRLFGKPIDKLPALASDFGHLACRNFLHSVRNCLIGEVVVKILSWFSPCETSVSRLD